jgi:hypothetical protein
MDHRVRELAERLLQRGFDDLTEREQRVIARIAKRLHISRNVNRAYDEQLTYGEPRAGRVARFGRSWTFIVLFGIVLLIWVALNSVVLTGLGAAFDPYPYVFLNLILSMLAAIRAPNIHDVAESAGSEGPARRAARLRGQPQGPARDHGLAREKWTSCGTAR